MDETHHPRPSKHDTRCSTVSPRATGDAPQFGNAILTRPRPPLDPLGGNTAPSSPCVDVERFRAELSEAGVDDMLGTLLTTFVEDAPARFAALEQAVQIGDAKAIETAAHAFKSGAGTIHATVLAASLASAENAARGGHLEAITDLIDQIRSEHLAVLRELEAILLDK
jgi:HPt (histidine-containing phosphotransfer) domain-containing protein